MKFPLFSSFSSSFVVFPFLLFSSVPIFMSVQASKRRRPLRKLLHRTHYRPSPYSSPSSSSIHLSLFCVRENTLPNCLTLYTYTHTCTRIEYFLPQCLSLFLSLIFPSSLPSPTFLLLGRGGHLPFSPFVLYGFSSRFSPPSILPSVLLFTHSLTCRPPTAFVRLIASGRPRPLGSLWRGGREGGREGGVRRDRGRGGKKGHGNTYQHCSPEPPHSCVCGKQKEEEVKWKLQL